jgi:predicted helicase
MYHFADKILNDRLSQLHYELLGDDLDLENKIIIYSFGKREVFAVLATKCLPNLDVFMPNATHCLALYRYDKSGNRSDNITDWALQQFTGHYQDDSISKEDIFHYTYAVLHNPEYRKKYEINLKREFPRLPFYEDFCKWAKWGKALMDLHINYESAEPYPLKIYETAHKDMPKAKLQAVPEKGEIILDENTSLSGIPASAWEYKLGNRSALHWILDQYKEKKPKDKTIAEKFNIYRFGDYKEQVIVLLKQVCAISVKTVDIVNKMEQEES